MKTRKVKATLNAARARRGRKKQAKPVSQTAKAFKPSKSDPTRTTTLRRVFIQQLRRRFALLKGRIVKLVQDEDAFGLGDRALQIATNSFCPTGPGGGVDATCSPSKGAKEREPSSLSHMDVLNEVADSRNRWGYKGPMQVVEGEGKEFEQGGVRWKEGGNCVFDSGRITIYSKSAGSSVDAVRRLTAHEMMHGTFERVLQQVELERKTAAVEEAPTRSGVKMRLDGAIYPEYQKDFPTLGRLQKFVDETPESTFAKDDGVSDYSKAYWKDYEQGKCSFHIAVHETLAEIAGHHEETGVIIGSKLYRDYYKTVRDEYRVLTGQQRERKKITTNALPYNEHNLYLTQDFKPTTPYNAAYLRWWRADGTNGWATRADVTSNSFCPTGVGGGVDPSCSPGQVSSSKSVVEKLKELGASAQHLEHSAKEYVNDKIASGVAKLPESMQTGVNAMFHVLRAGTKVAFATWIATQSMAERVAKERGLSDEEARRLRGVLSNTDIAAFKPIAIAQHMTGLSTATVGMLSFIPPASASYLAYSTARDPVATLRAAKGVVKDAIGYVQSKLPKSDYHAHQPKFAKPGLETLGNALTSNALSPIDAVNRITDALESHRFDDYYVALLSAAMDEVEDMTEAIGVADRAYEQHLASNSNPEGCNQYKSCGGSGKTHDVWHETNHDAADILLTQGVRPDFKREKAVDESTQGTMGSGLDRGIYVAKGDAFSKGSLGNVRLHLSLSEDQIDVPTEAKRLGYEKGKEVAGEQSLEFVMKNENGAVTTDEIHPSQFSKVDVYKDGKWESMSPKEYLSSRGLENTPRLPGMKEYEKALRDNAEQWGLKERNIQQSLTDYNRGKLGDKIYLAQEVGLVSNSDTQPADEYVQVNSTLASNTRFAFHSDADKIEAFQQWLQQQFADTLVDATSEQLWDEFIKRGFSQGAGRSFDDIRKSDYWKTHPEVQQSVEDFYRGSREEFLRTSFARPVTKEKVELLAGRAFDELENVTSDMSNKMSRVLADGLVRGDSPDEVASALTDEVDISSARAETIARTELTRAHAEGQLTALENLGVDEVGVMVEWVTAGGIYCSDLKKGKGVGKAGKEGKETPTKNAKGGGGKEGKGKGGKGKGVKEKLPPCVCRLCEPLEGVVLKIDEARGMLPRHPSCRCAWVPSNVGESDKDQKREKDDIDDAMQKSGVDDADIAADRPAANTYYDNFDYYLKNAFKPGYLKSERVRVDNAFCPTGEGGGVDSSCSPNGEHPTYSAMKAAYEKRFGADGKNLPPKERTTLHKAYVKALADWRNAGSPEPKSIGTIKAVTSKETASSQPATPDTHSKQVTAKIKELGESKGNLVHLQDLHDSLPHLSREQFVNAVQKARREGTVSLAGAEGRYGVSERDKRAWIHEDEPGKPGGSKLLYASLRHTHNAFCPTGPGGGVDPTCSPKSSSSKGIAESDVTAKEASSILEKIKSEPTTPPPPGKFYAPPVSSDNNRDGVTDAARVGVPAMQVPPPPDIMKLPHLTPLERAVETNFINAYQSNPDGIAESFRKLITASTKAGEAPTFGTDDAKVLTSVWSHEVAAIRAGNRATLNNCLHQVANAIAKRAFLQHLDTLKEGDEVMVTVGGCGCHAQDTPLLMHNGSLKMVQDIRVGDELMGPDSKPRKVLRLIRGVGKMYRIIPKKGKPFVVNEDHVLSIHTMRAPRRRDRLTRMNITVKRFLSKAKGFRHLSYLHRAKVEFPYQPVPLDPYFLGIWLGNGTHSLPQVTTPHQEVVKYLEGFTEQFPQTELVCFDKDSLDGVNPNKSKDYKVALLDKYPGKGTENPVTQLLKQLDVFKNKHIPKSYMINDRQTRLRLLAGLMDTDGTVDGAGFSISTKDERMAYDIAYLCRSLGYAAYISSKWVTNDLTGGVPKMYWLVSINGKVTEMPTKVANRKPRERTINKNPLRVGFSIEPEGVDNYYGFTLEGDGLYLMDDFTVTHNSGKGYALKNVPKALEMKQGAKAVWDSAGDQNATENPWIQQECEKRGLKANYVYVHADPYTQWSHPERGVVKRAGDPNDGRMVDAKVFADSYALGAKNHQAFYERNKDNPNASFIFLENRGKPKELDGVPKEALQLDRNHLANFAVKSVIDSNAPAHVKRGALAGQRIWGNS